MTPQQKAKDLYDQFYNAISFDFPISWHEEAKRCALIAVEEIEHHLQEFGEETDELQNMDRHFAWWGQVKQEIEKL